MSDSPSKPWDILIVGGGIAGAALFRDSVLRSHRTLLIEKDTLAAGTSSKSSRLIHGGIRYLENAARHAFRGRLREAWMDLKFVFLSLREARILERIASDLVQPLPILLPVYRKQKRNALWIYAGAVLYYLLARFSGHARFPKYLNESAVRSRVPGLNPNGLKAGVLIWERITEDAGLVQRTAASAVRHGGRLEEGARLTAYRYLAAEKLFEVEIQKGSSVTKELTRVLVNATGPWLDITRQLGQTSSSPMIRPVAGAHITLRQTLPVSILAEGADGRPVFFVRTKQGVRIGTTERSLITPDGVKPEPWEIEYLLQSAHNYFPEWALDADSLQSSDAGVRPLAVFEKSDGDAHELSREHKLFKDAYGVYHLAGVKLTDHRRAAEETLNRIQKECALSKRPAVSQTAERKLDD